MLLLFIPPCILASIATQNWLSAKITQVRFIPPCILASIATLRFTRFCFSLVGFIPPCILASIATTLVAKSLRDTLHLSPLAS